MAGQAHQSNGADEGRKQNDNKAFPIWTVFVVVTVTLATEADKQVDTQLLYTVGVQFYRG